MLLALLLLACVEPANPEDTADADAPDTAGADAADTADTAADTAVHTGDTGPADSGDTGAPPVDADGDGFVAQDDCDDADASVHPGAQELPCDAVDGDCDGLGADEAFRVDGVGYADLQDAVDDAEDGGTVEVCPGTHAVVGVEIGDPSPTTLTIRGWSGDAEDTVLDGGGAGRILAVWSGALRLEDLTLRNGVAAEGEDGGGALHASRSDLAIVGVRFTDNTSADQGGAIRALLGDPAVSGLRIEDTTFDGNHAGLTGGAVYASNDTSGSTPTVVTVARTSFSSNTAADGQGALDLYARWLDATVSDATLRGNGATDGPAGAGAISGETVDLALTGTVVSDNAADGWAGGLLVEATTLAARVETSTFDGNLAGGAAGALWMQASTGTIALRDSTFSSSRGSGVGGVYTEVGTGAVTVEACAFDANADATGGGGLYVHGADVVLEVSGSTFTDNAGFSYGGLGVWTDGGVLDGTIRDTVFSGNTSGYGAAGTVYMDTGTLVFEDATVTGNDASAQGGGFKLAGRSSFAGVGAVEVRGGSWTANTAGSGGALYVDEPVVSVEDVDLGAGASDNSPDDVNGCSGSWGSGATFTYDAVAGTLCE